MDHLLVVCGFSGGLVGAVGRRRSLDARLALVEPVEEEVDLSVLDEIGEDEADEEVVQTYGDEHTDEQGDEETQDDPSVPFRECMMHRPVLHQHRGEREVVFLAEVVKNGNIVLATIVEDAPLYLAVAHVGVVVEVLQPLFRTVVQRDVLLHLVVVVGQRASDVDGYCSGR